MSQSKRPGAKDISELKARLGLKKSGPAPGKGGAAVGARGGAIPAPPGASPPRPHIPDAKDDPFGAMNALAAHGAAQAAAPTIVVVNDGAPVEEVRRKARGRLYILGAVMLVPLIVGVAIGKISSGAKAYNRTMDDAASIRDDTKKVRQGLITLQQVLVTGKQRGRGKFVSGDSKLTAELERTPPIQPNVDVVFNSFMYNLPPELVAATLSFYVDTIELNDLIKKHVQQSKDADKVLKEGMVHLQGFNPTQYAGLIEIPSEDEQKSGKLVTLKVVQLGSPVCEGQTKPSDQGCQGKVGGFRYRPDELGPWGVKKIATGSEGQVTADTLVMLDPTSKALQQLVKGGNATVAESSYMDRINKIDERVNELIERQKAIETRMNSKANDSRKFTFFM